MDNKKRLTIIVLSVLFGTIISAWLFMFKRGGTLTKSDLSSLVFNMFFALAIVVFIGVILNRKKEK